MNKITSELVRHENQSWENGVVCIYTYIGVYHGQSIENRQTLSNILGKFNFIAYINGGWISFDIALCPLSKKKKRKEGGRVGCRR